MEEETDHYRAIVALSRGHKERRTCYTMSSPQAVPQPENHTHMLTFELGKVERNVLPNCSYYISLPLT